MVNMSVGPYVHLKGRGKYNGEYWDERNEIKKKSKAWVRIRDKFEVRVSN